eukprot:2770247-Rhodomonas_salina.2
MVSTSPDRASMQSPGMTHGRTPMQSPHRHGSGMSLHAYPPKLRVLSGTEKGATFELRPGRNLVGRADDCVVQLGTNGISKHHAVVHYESGHESACFVEDLGSTNKSLLGSLDEPVTLIPGHIPVAPAPAVPARAWRLYAFHRGCDATSGTDSSVPGVVFGDSACVFLWGPARSHTQSQVPTHVCLVTQFSMPGTDIAQRSGISASSPDRLVVSPGMP